MMESETVYTRLKGWLAFLPIRLSYRIIWLASLTRHPTPVAVYEAMWRANLALPQEPKA